MENDPYNSVWAQSTTDFKVTVALGKLIFHGKREKRESPLAQEPAARGCHWSREFHGCCAKEKLLSPQV